MVVQGPGALGRSVVVAAGQAAPPTWSTCRRIVIDDAAMTAPSSAVFALHSAWARREPVVVELACDAAALREPETCKEPVWSLTPSFELLRERLQFLVWANAYDARSGDPIWWHGRRALRLLAGRGVVSGGSADLVAPDGMPVYVDGGPFPPPAVAGASLVHRWSVEAGELRPVRYEPAAGTLADDQRRAVEHGAGPARVIAPAGSGKTRVLTERLRHLLRDRAAAPSSIMALAFNDKAAEELRRRTGLARTGEGTQVRTINSLGLWICTQFGRSRLEVLGDEWKVRELVQKVFDVPRRANADTTLPYIDALSAVRLGLQSPAAVEDALPDAAGLTEGFDRYRDALRIAGAVDYDEQVYRAIEILLTDPSARREAQARCRTVLVDELQDLNPAHLLLIRLLCAPAFDCFGVGDDDQVIYGYSGATPEYLIDFGRYFPSAAEYALEVNYRCAPAIVVAATNLLSHNEERISKVIRAHPDRSDELPSFDGPLLGKGPVVVTGGPPDVLAHEARDILSSWFTAGVAFDDVAVLARVSSVLLPVQIELTTAGIPCTRPLGPKVLERTGVRAALAYLRIGLAPHAISRGDLEVTLRRPPRGIARNVVDMLLEKPMTSLGAIRGLAGRLSGRDGPKVGEYADAVALVARRCKVSSAEALRAIRVEVGLETTMDALDSSRKEADRSTHLDDLVALESVAALHPEAADLETWLRRQLDAPAPVGPAVLLSTIHKIKGREWDYVILYGASSGTMPHRLSGDDEGERRIFHVGLTRAKHQVVVLADASAPSPFVRELQAPRPRSSLADRPRRAPRATADRRAPDRAAERERAPVPRTTRTADLDALVGVLRTWRAQAAKKAGVPAFVVLHDKHLLSIVERGPRTLAELAQCKGMGPMKLERWGDEILAALSEPDFGP